MTDTTQKTLRAAIIGLGVGEQHVFGYNSHPQASVVALCDRDEEKRAEVAARHPGVAMRTDAREVLLDPEIEMVSICTYDNFHVDQVVQALEHGKHVFVEKPLCLNREEALLIRNALRKNPGLQLSSNLILRKSPRFILLQKRIATGEMGRLFSVEGDYNYGRLHKIISGWRGQIPYYSVICGGGVHMIDLLLWLTGDRVRRVTAMGNRIASEGTDFRHFDYVSALMEFESGMVGKVVSNYGCVYPHHHRLSIYGTEATFVNEPECARIYHSRDPQEKSETISDDYPGYRKGDHLYSFVDAVAGKGEPEVTTDQVFDVMSICFAIDESALSGKAIDVDYV